MMINTIRFSQPQAFGAPLDEQQRKELESKRAELEATRKELNKVEDSATRHSDVSESRFQQHDFKGGVEHFDKAARLRKLAAESPATQRVDQLADEIFLLNREDEE